ncbi:AAA family ATPase [Enterococcus rivorum]|uniref:Kinase n=1 Tax=Enterococcus rivorum TaxID=762845 RepID=A0A1E5L0Y2_9ENTE|nr:AAA family ATPase [Enterococcus rivorum]MBP2098647.1 putative kinase [Enterococcus rivorum]OEH83743.1 kinase [Enterococcus rivorum]
MKRTLLLLAGPPATGKTYLISKMRRVIPDFFLITPDEIKEMYADRFGFDNLKEKADLELEVWQFYYSILDQYMTAGKKVIVTEYPFSEKQKPKLKILAERHDYQVITIRLVADFDVLWQRRQLRDQEQERHLSHIMSHYQAGDCLLERAKADNHISKADFAEIIAKRKYNEFQLGELFEVEVSDFSKVNYEELLEQIKNEI